METTKNKVGRVLLIITLIIAFVGCMLMAITLPFLSTVGVASADSTNGVVEDNLLYESDFNGLSGSSTSSVDLSDYWRLGGAGSNNNRIFSNNTLTCSVADTNGYYANIRQDISSLTRSTNITFRVQSTSHTYNWLVQLWYYTSSTGSPTQGYSSGYVNADYISATFTLPSNYTYIYFIIQTRGTLVLDYCKLEYGDTFTGYVPKDYTNYGYNQGLEEGYNNEFDLRNYRLLDPFSYTSSTSTNINFPSNHYSTSFTFDNKRFGVSTYYPVTSLVPTAYNNLCPFYTLYSSSITYYNGIKYSNDLLSGDILITFPFRFANNDFDLMFCFEDTVTGSLNYVTSKDSLHWFWGDVIGTTYGSYQVFTCQVHYYSANPVNLYVFQVGLNPVYNTTDIDVIVTRAIWFPLDCIWANIYATSTGSALNDFDSGYNKGKEDGIASVNTDNYFNYGYRQGYDKGHTDGVAEHTNYSFLGLISAVVDAPIKAFSGLLEFEILGVNLKNFVLGLLTLAVIIIIIKIALGGK